MKPWLYGIYIETRPYYSRRPEAFVQQRPVDLLEKKIGKSANRTVWYNLTFYGIICLICTKRTKGSLWEKSKFVIVKDTSQSDHNLEVRKQIIEIAYSVALSWGSDSVCKMH